MTHETAIKIDGRIINFRFGIRAFYRCSQFYETDFTGLFKRAESDFIGYWRTIVYFAALDCEENGLAELEPDDVFTWFDKLPERDHARLLTAHNNAKILGKQLGGGQKSKPMPSQLPSTFWKRLRWVFAGCPSPSSGGSRFVNSTTS